MEGRYSLRQRIVEGFVAALCIVTADATLDASRRVHQDREQPVRCEFRIFDGETEVTGESRVRMYPSGTKEAGVTVEPADGRLVADVAPAIYDAQIIRQRDSQVLNIRWAERLVVMRYPDEGGQHLEAINFKPSFGALQMAVPGPTTGVEYDIAVFAADPNAATRAGAERRAVAKPIKAPGYHLFVVPAGRYDVRIRRSGAGGAVSESEGERWLLDLEVPAERTRLKRVDGQ